ncbi:MAG: HAD-IG family 5'-nucleotidase [Chloroflexi bacterium]|nr:HAD-IG family 5'-nucleotidase [Chloroflexota bacterium]
MPPARLPTPAELAPLALPLPGPERGIYCNRALNLRGSVRAVGYDMDYTLIHYQAQRWEERAFAHLTQKIAELGWPVEGLRFDPELVIRGLLVDRELGNFVKANQFGYIKAAAHGTRMLEYDALRQAYRDVFVEGSDPRWASLDTLFALSEASMYGQLVDRLDAGLLPPGLGYADLHERVRGSIDLAHMEGQLKAEIVADPDRFVDLDPAVPLTLLDQRAAGKKLLLVTNSEWDYTRSMMAYAFDRFLPGDMGWRELFDVVIVGARKPAFFHERMPLLEVVDDSGLLRPARAEAGQGGVFLGGHAALVETMLGLSGAEILYVGDHMYGDVRASKGIQRWRTALILRELEAELAATAAFDGDQRRIEGLMADKAAIELEFSRLRLDLQRQRARPAYGPASQQPAGRLRARMAELRAALLLLDEQIAPIAVASSQLHNLRWGLLLRAGNDRSLLAHQIEQHADVYTSRVSNFLLETPFVYFRPPSGRLPHDDRHA